MDLKLRRAYRDDIYYYDESCLIIQIIIEYYLYLKAEYLLMLLTLHFYIFSLDYIFFFFFYFTFETKISYLFNPN